MGLNTTRGGLQPATIVNLNSGETVRCMFNPFEYTLGKSNSWQRKEVKGKNVPNVVFRQGGSQTLKLTLHFDTRSDGADVRDYTDPLWNMMLVDEAEKNPKSGKSTPPHVAFRWGKLDFEAVITSLNQRFTLFTDAGTPVRCQVDITLEQFIDVNDYAPQQPGAAAAEAEKTVTVTLGDRLDNIAASNGGEPDDWRSIADKNDIDDPLKLQPGQQLRV